MSAEIHKTGISKLVIVGRDAAAWLSANAMVRAFGATGLDIEVVELPSLLRPHDVYAGLPAQEAFHTLLGFDEHALLRASAGAFSLGQSFVNFSGPRPPFFHPYGAHGAPFGNSPFLQFWVKARQKGLNVAFEDFSINAAAAKQGRFFVPNDELRALGRCDYAYHLEARAYMQFLKDQALKRGVVCSPVRLFDVRRDADGDIEALVLADGRIVTGDLFIDATGADSLLLGQAMGAGFESWAQWFPFDRQIAAAADPLRVLPAYSQVRALKAGCLHILPTQGQTALLHAYDSRVQSDDAALRDAAVVSQMRLREGAVVSGLAPGRRHQAWAGNCIAVGEAAGVFDPIDNVGLQAVQLALAYLITLFPLDRAAHVERADYNRLIAQALDHLRDFQIAHYRLNRMIDQPVWDAARAASPPERLAWRMEVFSACGRVPHYDEESFDGEDWASVFLGHGLMPQGYDLAVDATPDDEAIGRVQQMLGFIRRQVEAMPPMNAYLEQHNAASRGAHRGVSV